MQNISSFHPWVGQNYDKGIVKLDDGVILGEEGSIGKRILILDECHFSTDTDRISSDYTIDIVSDFASQTSTSIQNLKLFTGIEKMLTGYDTNYERDKLWSHLAYYTYIQSPVTAPWIAPADSNYTESFAAFELFVNRYKPNAIIVLGNRLHEKIKDLIYKREPKINVSIIVTSHPLGSFDWKVWHEKVKKLKRNKNYIEFIEEVIFPGLDTHQLNELCEGLARKMKLHESDIGYEFDVQNYVTYVTKKHVLDEVLGFIEHFHKSNLFNTLKSKLLSKYLGLKKELNDDEFDEIASKTEILDKKTLINSYKGILGKEKASELADQVSEEMKGSHLFYHYSIKEQANFQKEKLSQTKGSFYFFKTDHLILFNTGLLDKNDLYIYYAAIDKSGLGLDYKPIGDIGFVTEQELITSNMPQIEGFFNNNCFVGRPLFEVILPVRNWDTNDVDYFLNNIIGHALNLPSPNIEIDGIDELSQKYKYKTKGSLELENRRSILLEEYAKNNGSIRTVRINKNIKTINFRKWKHVLIDGSDNFPLEFFNIFWSKKFKDNEISKYTFQVELFQIKEILECKTSMEKELEKTIDIATRQQIKNTYQKQIDKLKSKTYDKYEELALIFQKAINRSLDTVKQKNHRLKFYFYHDKNEGTFNYLLPISLVDDQTPNFVLVLKKDNSKKDTFIPKTLLNLREAYQNLTIMRFMNKELWIKTLHL